MPIRTWLVGLAAALAASSCGSSSSGPTPDPRPPTEPFVVAAGIPSNARFAAGSDGSGFLVA